LYYYYFFFQFSEIDGVDEDTNKELKEMLQAEISNMGAERY